MTYSQDGCFQNEHEEMNVVPKKYKIQKNKAELSTKKNLSRKFWSIRLRLFLRLKKEETIKDKKGLIKRTKTQIWKLLTFPI